MTETESPPPPAVPHVERQWPAALPVREGESELLWLENWNYRVPLGAEQSVIGFRHGGQLLALFARDLGDRTLTLGLDAALLYVVERDVPVSVTDLRLAFEAVAQAYAADTAQLAEVVEVAERQHAEPAPSQPPHSHADASDGPGGHADADRPADATTEPATEPPSPEPERPFDIDGDTYESDPGAPCPVYPTPRLVVSEPVADAADESEA
jgi:hypothetical protein